MFRVLDPLPRLSRGGDRVGTVAPAGGGRRVCPGPGEPRVERSFPGWSRNRRRSSNGARRRSRTVCRRLPAERSGRRRLRPPCRRLALPRTPRRAYSGALRHLDALARRAGGSRTRPSRRVRLLLTRADPPARPAARSTCGEAVTNRLGSSRSALTVYFRTDLVGTLTPAAYAHRDAVSLAPPLAVSSRRLAFGPRPRSVRRAGGTVVERPWRAGRSRAGTAAGPANDR